MFNNTVNGTESGFQNWMILSICDEYPHVFVRFEILKWFIKQFK